jgi:hypothetical protein
MEDRKSGQEILVNGRDISFKRWKLDRNPEYWYIKRLGMCGSS